MNLMEGYTLAHRINWKVGDSARKLSRGHTARVELQTQLVRMPLPLLVVAANRCVGFTFLFLVMNVLSWSLHLVGVISQDF